MPLRKEWVCGDFIIGEKTMKTILIICGIISAGLLILLNPFADWIKSKQWIKRIYSAMFLSAVFLCLLTAYFCHKKISEIKKSSAPLKQAAASNHLDVFLRNARAWSVFSLPPEITGGGADISAQPAKPAEASLAEEVTKESDISEAEKQLLMEFQQSPSSDKAAALAYEHLRRGHYALARYQLERVSAGTADAASREIADLLAKSVKSGYGPLIKNKTAGLAFMFNWEQKTSTAVKVNAYPLIFTDRNEWVKLAAPLSEPKGSVIKFPFDRVRQFRIQFNWTASSPGNAPFIYPESVMIRAVLAGRKWNIIDKNLATPPVRLTLLLAR